MKYLEPRFSVASPGTQEYADNWERIFGKRCMRVSTSNYGVETRCHEPADCPCCAGRRCGHALY